MKHHDYIVITYPEIAMIIIILIGIALFINAIRHPEKDRTYNPRSYENDEDS